MEEVPVNLQMMEKIKELSREKMTIPESVGQNHKGTNHHEQI